MTHLLNTPPYSRMGSFKKILTISVIMITGCSSFNRYDLSTPNPALLPDIHGVRQLTPTQAKDALSAVDTCPIAQFADLPPIPAKPIAALRKVKPGDEAGLDDVELNYISALREYVREVNHQVDSERAAYYAECKHYQEALSGMK